MMIKKRIIIFDIEILVWSGPVSHSLEFEMLSSYTDLILDRAKGELFSW